MLDCDRLLLVRLVLSLANIRLPLQHINMFTIRCVLFHAMWPSSWVCEVGRQNAPLVSQLRISQGAGREWKLAHHKLVLLTTAGIYPAVSAAACQAHQKN
jgi:hypothetical protein